LTIHEPLLNSLELSEHRKPSSFALVVEMLKSLILQDFDREIASKRLYYHTRAHIEDVQRRADIIFEAICPYWQAPVEQDIARTRLLLNLCAVAHDAIQVFTPQTSPHTSRQRASGKSETLTIEKLLDYIEKLNQQLQEYCVDESVLFSSADISIIKDAISFPQEIASFPIEAISILTNKVFKYLNVESICEIESDTPTDENTSLNTLIDFFHLDSRLL
jgi:hypothetical protein